MVARHSERLSGHQVNGPTAIESLMHLLIAMAAKMNDGIKRLLAGCCQRPLTHLRDALDTEPPLRLIVSKLFQL
jgi:hypothetical protein